MINDVKAHSKKLKGYMLKRLLPLTIGGCCILGMMAIGISSNGLIRTSNELLEEISKSYAQNIELRIESESVDSVSGTTNDSRFLDTGIVYILDDEGTIISHNDKKVVAEKRNYIKDNKGNEEVLELHKIMLSGKSGVSEYTLNGVKKRVAYTPMPNTGWALAAEVDESDILSDVDKLKVWTVALSVVITIVISIGVILNARSITSKLQEVMLALRRFAEGDFTYSISSKILKDETEIGEMCNALTATQDSIGNIIKVIKSGADNVEANSAGLAAVSEELSALTENIVKAIEEVATGTTTQSADLGDIVGELTSFGERLGFVESSIIEINSMSEVISKKSQEGNVELNELVTSIKSFDTNFSEFNESIKVMSSDIKRVNEMANLINNISGQTNLLALNAAIEAARAGESGRGFAVVAEEIRTLAELSKESTGNIYKIVGGILENTDNIRISTDNMDKELDNQSKVVDKTINAFKEISSSVDNIMPKIAEIAISFDEVNTNKGVILSKVENISAVSQEISATTEEVSATSEELNSASEEVAASAQNLTVLTSEMNEKIDTLKVN